MEISEAIELGIKKLAELNFEGRRGLNKLDVYFKPTKSPQTCFFCRAELQRGDSIVKEVSGATSRGYLEYAYSHFDCYLAMIIHTILGLEVGE